MPWGDVFILEVVLTKLFIVVCLEPSHWLYQSQGPHATPPVKSLNKPAMMIPKIWIFKENYNLLNYYMPKFNIPGYVINKFAFAFPSRQLTDAQCMSTGREPQPHKPPPIAIKPRPRDFPQTPLPRHTFSTSWRHLPVHGCIIGSQRPPHHPASGK